MNESSDIDFVVTWVDGADSSSQSGFCPAVTRKTFRTHGAHASTARNQCRSVPKSR